MLWRSAVRSGWFCRPPLRYNSRVFLSSRYRFAALGLVFLLWGGTAFSQLATKTVSAFSLLQEASRLIAAGRLKKAETTLNEILKADPKEYQAWNLLGVVRAEQGRQQEAEQLFQKAVQGDSRITGAHVNLGLLYLQTGHPKDAAGQFEQALKLEPDRKDIQKHLVQALQVEASGAIKEGNNQQALALLLHVSRLIPSDAVVRYELGDVELRMGLFQNAQSSFEASLHMRPNDPDCLLGLASAEIGMKQPAEAAPILRQYLKIRPQNAAAHYALGYVLRLMQQNVEARTELNLCLKLDPQQVNAVFQLGVIDLEEGKFDRAAARFREVLKKYPEHLGAMLSMGQLDYERKDYDAARGFLTRVIARNPQSYKAHYYLGLCYARLGQRELSRRELATAVKLQRQHEQSSRVVVRLLEKNHGSH